MSPTATIAAVVVALVFVAWIFQTDTKDPGYEAWLKRQQEERRPPHPKQLGMIRAATLW